MAYSWFSSSLLGSNSSRPSSASSTMSPYATSDRPESSYSSTMSPYATSYQPESSYSSTVSPYRASDRPESPFKGLPSPDAARVIALLKDKSADELRKLVDDKSAYDAFFNSLEQVKDNNNLRHDLWEETLQLARENLQKETHIAELQNQCKIIRTTELAAAQEKLKELEKQKGEILRSDSPLALLQNLQDAMNKGEEESEILHTKLIEKDVDLATFLQKYKKLRHTYHKRALTQLAAQASLM